MLKDCKKKFSITQNTINHQFLISEKNLQPAQGESSAPWEEPQKTERPRKNSGKAQEHWERPGSLRPEMFSGERVRGRWRADGTSYPDMLEGERSKHTKLPILAGCVAEGKKTVCTCRLRAATVTPSLGFLCIITKTHAWGDSGADILDIACLSWFGKQNRTKSLEEQFKVLSRNWMLNDIKEGLERWLWG